MIGAIIEQMHFVEVFTLLATTRMIWAQLADSRIPNMKRYPLVLLAIMYPLLLDEYYKAEIRALQSVDDSHTLTQELSHTSKRRNLIFEYNVFKSKRQSYRYISSVVGILAIVKWSPWLLASVAISDLVVTRIHHHILHSFR